MIRYQQHYDRELSDERIRFIGIIVWRMPSTDSIQLIDAKWLIIIA